MYGMVEHATVERQTEASNDFGKMMSMTTGLLLFGASVSVVYLLHVLWTWYDRYARGLPAGPIGWPVIGNLFFLSGTGIARHQQISAIGRRYGGIFSTTIGGSRAVWVTSYKYFREANVENAWEFAGRPDIMWIKEGHAGIVGSGVDESSRNVRKFSLITLRNFGFGKTSMQDAILEEFDQIKQEFKKLTGKSFNPRYIMANAAVNVISSISLGKTFPQGDENLQVVNTAVTEALVQVGRANIDRQFPILHYLPLKRRAAFANSMGTAQNFLKGIIKDHQDTHEHEKSRDFIDAWLEERGKSVQTERELSLERLPNVLLDLFAAGFETTATTFQWLFAMLLHHPEVQEKIHEEMVVIPDSANHVTLEDREALPYTEAVILETLRLCSPVAGALPHESTKDARLGPYILPKGTRILFQLYSIHHDPDLWPEPEEFRPERFTESGVIKTPDCFVPFGAGRRSCIGEQLARKELFLFFANILRNFRILLPDGDSLPSLEMVRGVVVHPPPFNVRLEER